MPGAAKLPMSSLRPRVLVDIFYQSPACPEIAVDRRLGEVITIAAGISCVAIGSVIAVEAVRQRLPFPIYGNVPQGLKSQHLSA